jgi:uncharacterized membrane protein YcaP (DUF421 family)
VNEALKALWAQVGIDGWQALAVVVGTIILYLFFALIISIFGQSLRARVSIFSFALFALIGSVTARSMLGEHPTLLGGLIVLTVLLIMELTFSKLRIGFDMFRPRRPKAVLVDGELQPEMLARSRLTEHQLWVKLRRAGICRPDQVHLAIIEADGDLTLYRQGQEIDPRLLAGVLGLPQEDAPSA